MKKFQWILIIVMMCTMIFVGCGQNNSNDTASQQNNLEENNSKENNGENNTTEAQVEEGSKEKTFEEEIDELLRSGYGEGYFSGSVLVAKGEEILFQKSYGMADFEKGTPNTEETKYDIASVTKQFTGLAIMQLQEKGLLKVDDTIDKYLTNFPQGDKITIHQLLTHTSGLPQHPLEFDIKAYKPSNVKDDGVVNKDEIKLMSEPGTTFQYSNVGYILAGYIIEKVSNQSLLEYFKTNIFDPLGMNNTGFKDENHYIQGLAIGYQSALKDKSETSFYDMNVGPRGAGGLCSTSKDLYLWNRALYSEKLVSKESMERILTPELSDYGYGWFITHDFDGNMIYEHEGTGPGFKSHIVRRPKDEVFIVILSNIGDTLLRNIVYDVQYNLDY